MAGPKTRSQTKTATILRRIPGCQCTARAPAVHINLLPNELLIGIIVLLRDSEFDPDDSHGPGYGWLKLAGVCRLWRSVMLNTPSLWTLIGVEQNLALFRLFLKRSQKLLVDVNFHVCFDAKCSSRKHMAIIRAIVKIAHRVRRLALDGVDDLAFTAFVKQFAPCMPRLEDLYLRLRKANHFPLPLSALVPRVRILRMYGAGFDPQHCSLASLVHLELGNTPIPIPMAHLLNVLANAPGLQTLVLLHAALVLPSKQLPSSTPAARTIDLTQLVTLGLHDSPDRLCCLLSTFVPVLACPTTTTLKLSLGSFVDREAAELGVPNMPMLDSDALRLALTVFPHIEQADCLHFLVAPDAFTLEVRQKGRPPLLSVDMHQDVKYQMGLFHEALCSLAYYLRGVPIRVLQIYGEPDSNSFGREYAWQVFLYSFPLLERIELSCLAVKGSIICSMLADHGGGGHASICPALKELEIHDFDSPRPDSLNMWLVKNMEARSSLQLPIQKLTLIHNGGPFRLSEGGVDKILAVVGEFKCTKDGLPTPLPQRLEHVSLDRRLA